MSTWASPSSSPEIVTPVTGSVSDSFTSNGPGTANVSCGNGTSDGFSTENVAEFSCSATTVNRPSAIDSATAWFSI